MDLPKIPILADIPTAALPTPGQGLTLNARGKIPSSVLPPSTTTGITGRVAATGAITAGTGFTVTKGATGVYTVNFTVAFSATPLVLTTPADGTNQNAIIAVVSVSTSSFGVSAFTGGVTSADVAFNFYAFPVK